MLLNVRSSIIYLLTESRGFLNERSQGSLSQTLHRWHRKQLQYLYKKPQKNPSEPKAFPFTLPYIEIPTVSIHTLKMCFLKKGT